MTISEVIMELVKQDNLIGIGFFFLLYYVVKNLIENTKIMQAISTSLVEVKNSLNTLNGRVDAIEKKQNEVNYYGHK